MLMEEKDVDYINGSNRTFMELKLLSDSASTETSSF